MVPARIANRLIVLPILTKYAIQKWAIFIWLDINKIYIEGVPKYPTSTYTLAHHVKMNLNKMFLSR